MFQHTAARRRLVQKTACRSIHTKFQHTAARRRLGHRRDSARRRDRFNTQPPEGGWHNFRSSCPSCSSFNTQPPEGGWAAQPICQMMLLMFQHTAARRRLGMKSMLWILPYQFQHTAARRRLVLWVIPISLVVFAFQHTAARRRLERVIRGLYACSLSFNTQPPEGGWTMKDIDCFRFRVSTHSRPKAAGTEYLEGNNRQ